MNKEVASIFATGYLRQQAKISDHKPNKTLNPLDSHHLQSDESQMPLFQGVTDGEGLTKPGSSASENDRRTTNTEMERGIRPRP